MKLEAYWCEQDGLANKVTLDLPGAPGGFRVEQAVRLLPTHLQELIDRGSLHLACFGQLRHLDSTLQEGDRLELVGPVLLDVKAERSARVKAARNRERGPYNRSFSGQSKSDATKSTEL
jgi:putative ubiquitin-RnfH superfamily antitoxin RatB of RatAB toxin-antitoxin module